MRKLHRNLGFWRALNDRAAWSIKTKQAGVYDVHLNWALDGKAKANRIQLRIGQNEIVHAVDSTGTWDQYRSNHIGTVELDEGEQRTIMQAHAHLRVCHRPEIGQIDPEKQLITTCFFTGRVKPRSPDDHVSHSSRDQMKKTLLEITVLAIGMSISADLFAQESRSNSRRTSIPRPFLYAYPEKPGESPLAKVRKSMLEQFDADKDGFLNKAERNAMRLATKEVRRTPRQNPTRPRTHGGGRGRLPETAGTLAGSL